MKSISEGQARKTANSIIYPKNRGATTLAPLVYQMVC